MVWATKRDYDFNRDSVEMSGSHVWAEVPTYCNRSIIEQQEFGYSEEE